MRKRSPYRFPWREGNRCRLHINGPRFFPAMLEAIGSATSHVLLEMYLVKSGRVTDRFIRAFADAARRGVRVQLLLDDFGSLGLSRSDREALRKSGVEVAYFNPLRVAKWRNNLFRTHRKLLQVDGRVAFVGGAGLSDDFEGPKAWRETMLEVSGPVNQDWQSLFQRNWRTWSRSPGTPLLQVQGFSDGIRGRVACSRGEVHVEVKRAFLDRIARARHRVWLATAYFVPSMKVRRGLRRAVRRGVDVRLLLPGPITDHPAVRHASHRYYARLLRHGVRIFEYQERFMHTKLALVDDWASIGSSNLDRWNLRWNLEANQEIHDADFAASLGDMLEEDLAHSVEYDYNRWCRRSLVQRIKEWFWGSVDLWLTGLFPSWSALPPGPREARPEGREKGPAESGTGPGKRPASGADRLREIRSHSAEVGGTGRRRWYTSPIADLYVWEDSQGVVRGFEFCYDKTREEHAVRWQAGRGLEHAGIDDGEPLPWVNATPIAVADGDFDARDIARRFEAVGAEVEPRIYRRVLQALLRGV